MPDPAATTPTSAPLLFGRYRVSEQLGETRLAAVYSAADERLQRRVLVHLLRKELVAQERARARVVADELIANGIPAARIRILYRGATPGSESLESRRVEVRVDRGQR